MPSRDEMEAMLAKKMIDIGGTLGEVRALTEHLELDQLESIDGTTVGQDVAVANMAAKRAWVTICDHLNPEGSRAN